MSHDITALIKMELLYGILPYLAIYQSIICNISFALTVGLPRHSLLQKQLFAQAFLGLFFSCS